MRNGLKARIGALLTVLLLLVCSVPAFAAEADGTDAATRIADIASALRDPSGRLLAVSKYGDTSQYPENSAAAITAAAEAGADMVYVHVRKTADNYFILMADENLSRMCVDELGNVLDRNVSEIGYHELSACHLRNGTGNLHESITEYTVPTLSEAIAAAKESGVLLLLDGVWDFRDEVYEQLSTEGTLGNVVFLARGDRGEVSDWMQSKAQMPLVISSYTGNVIFSAKSAVSRTLSAGAVGTLLGSSNSYSVVFGDSVMSEFSEKGRGVIDMTDPDLCGEREDNYIGYNDVTARGYSVIITNNITELCEYYARVSTQESRLSAALASAQRVDVTLCSTESANELKDAISAARDALSVPVSENSLMQANYALRMAVAGLTNRTEDSGGSTITAGRVIAAVLVVAALVVLEIVVMRIRRKKLEKRKRARRREREQQHDE